MCIAYSIYCITVCYYYYYILYISLRLLFYDSILWFMTIYNYLLDFFDFFPWRPPSDSSLDRFLVMDCGAATDAGSSCSGRTIVLVDLLVFGFLVLECGDSFLVMDCGAVDCGAATDAGFSCSGRTIVLVDLLVLAFLVLVCGICSGDGSTGSSSLEWRIPSSLRSGKITRSEASSLGSCCRFREGAGEGAEGCPNVSMNDWNISNMEFIWALGTVWPVCDERLGIVGVRPGMCTWCCKYGGCWINQVFDELMGVKVTLGYQVICFQVIWG